MKILFVCAAIFCVFAFVIGVARSFELSNAEVEARKPKNRVADSVVSQIQYIKDPRTGLCFAYFWGGDAYYWYGGPALATVPCESIPPELLTIANVPMLTKKD